MSWTKAFRNLATFRHGVHPAERKDATAHLPIERMRFVDQFVVPLSQHLGAPATVLVNVGDRILRGQQIGAPTGYISTAVHAPATGTVKAIELRPHPGGKPMLSVVICADPYDDQQAHLTAPPPFASLSPAEVVDRIQQAGLVGLGGAAFPSHVKLKVPGGKQVQFFVLNGCECEPYLTCDHRVMVEHADRVVRGLQLSMKQVGAKRGYIGVENNKPDAIEALRAELMGNASIEVIPLAVKYPQGAEKMLVDAIFKREIPSGKLPLDLEIVVNNVGTTAALAQLFETGLPLIERVVTVTGPGVKRPGNILVPLGTPVREVLEHCGGLSPQTRQVILGGPMMGMSQKNLEVPIIKGTSGILALTTDVQVESEEACIRCGRCLEACPMFLNPSRIAQLVRNDRPEDLGQHHVLDCFECASCSYVCPSRIPLVQLMRMGKAMYRQEIKKNAEGS